MSVVKEVIEDFYAAKAQIFSIFDVDGYMEIVNNIEHPWRLHSDEISYLKDDVYSYEYANQVGNTVDGIQMFYVQENGEKYYALFDLKNHLTEEEAEEKLSW